MPHADVNGQRIFFEDTGGDGPPVILAHGFLMDHEMFVHQVAALRDDYRVITWDERGFGQTEYDGEPFTYWDSANDCLALLDHLGIDQVLSVIGGSMGGMQVLEWAATYKERVFSAIPIACSARHSSQNIAFHEVGRQAVMADPDWCEGRYLEEGKSPRKGLAVARMAAHITYLSDAALHDKFGRNLQDREEITFGFDTYTLHPGESMSLDPSVPHLLTNPGTVPAKGIWVVHHCVPIPGGGSDD